MGLQIRGFDLQDGEIVGTVGAYDGRLVGLAVVQHHFYLRWLGR